MKLAPCVAELAVDCDDWLSKCGLLLSTTRCAAEELTIVLSKARYVELAAVIVHRQAELGRLRQLTLSFQTYSSEKMDVDNRLANELLQLVCDLNGNGIF